MMEPLTWPPTTHAVPTLWERTKAMFVVTPNKARSAMRLAFRRLWTLQQRRDFVLHLEPAERIIRVQMLLEAITLRVMAPQGLKLRQATRPCRGPDPPTQVGTHNRNPAADRVHAAMVTIAANRPRTDPSDEGETDLTGPLLHLARRIAAVPGEDFQAPGPVGPAPSAGPMAAPNSTAPASSQSPPSQRSARLPHAGA